MSLEFRGLEGKIVDKSHPDYEKEVIGWNRAHTAKPLAIIFCENARDISNVLRVAKREEMAVRIRSGRHHYEGFSIADDAIIIDVSKMKDIKIDEVEGTVTIGAGVINQEIYTALNSKGYPFPGGGCPSVGVVGLTLNGGWGYSSRFLGLACDSLIEAEIVDQSANVFKCSTQGHKEAFWGIRGAGAGNFGVVTSMKFKLAEKVDRVTLVLIDYKEANIDEKTTVIETLQREFKTMDNRFNAKIAIYNSEKNGKGIYITGMFYGAKEEAEDILSSFNELSENESFKLIEMSVLEANNYIQDSHPEFEKYKSGGRFVYRDFSVEEIKSLLEMVEEREEGSVYTAVSFYGLGGVIDSLTNEEMAYGHRGASFILGIQSVWNEDQYAEQNRKFVLDRYNKLKEITTGSYVGFPIKELENYEEEYFNKNAEELRLIKYEYDKRNVFAYEQGLEGKYDYDRHIE
ncbi:MAG: FAD-binding oxidoreductase [Sarcina sp.]